MTANILPQFPQSPGNVFQAQPVNLTLAMREIAGNPNFGVLKVEMAGYWLACTTDKSTPGAKFGIKFDQNDAVTPMVPGQVVYVQFQYFTIVLDNQGSSNAIDYGSLNFKIGRGAQTFYSENSACVPSTPNEYENPVVSYDPQVENDTTADNFNGPTITNPRLCFPLTNRRGFRVALNSDVEITAANIRLWWGKLVSGSVVWYAGQVIDSLTCSGKSPTAPASLPGTRIVSADYETAVPYGYVYPQLLGATAPGKTYLIASVEGY